MFRYDYNIRYSDYKDFETVKTSAILEVIQEAAILNSASCGYGIDNLRSINRAWLLQGINVRIENPVSTYYPLIAKTAVKSLKGVLSERGTIIAQNGKTVVKSIANWCLLDTERMRLARIPKEMTGSYEHYDFGDEFFTYERPEIIEGAPEMYKIRISNKELDTNKHLNNQKGAELLMDAIPFDFDIKDIKLYYPNPAYLGEELSVCVKEMQNGYYVHLKNIDGAVCVAGTFENK